MELLGRHTVILGKRGEGKSNLVQYLLDQYPNHLVYDICREHDREWTNRYLPEHRSGDRARAEAGEVVKRAVTGVDRDRRPDLFVIEEASRVAPNKGGVHDAIMDLVDLGRHYDCGTLVVARRPAKIDTSLVELADNVLTFYIDGKNDVRALNSFKSGVGDMAKELDPYHFLRIAGRDVTHHQPVPEMETTGRL